MKKISNQNAGWIAERFVGSGSASAQRGCVDHVIVQQCCGVNELYHSCQSVAMRASVVQCSAYHEQKCWAQSFAARCNDVLGDLAYQWDCGCQALPDDGINFTHVLCDQREG